MICLLRKQSSRSGQLNVEYFLGLILFIIITLYFAFRLIDFYPQYLRSVRSEILRSDVYRLSEMLINDDGEPGNWANPGITVRRLGLSSEGSNSTNVLNSTKVVEFETRCNADYQNVKRLVGAGHDFYMVVNDTTDEYTCNMLPDYEDLTIIRRVVAFDNGNYGRLVIYMWW